MKHLITPLLFALCLPACLGGGGGASSKNNGDCRNAALACADGFECRGDARGAFQCVVADDGRDVDPRGGGDGAPGDRDGRGDADIDPEDDPRPVEDSTTRECRTLCSGLSGCGMLDEGDDDDCERYCAESLGDEPSVLEHMAGCAADRLLGGRCEERDYLHCVDETRTCERACALMVECGAWGDEECREDDLDPDPAEGFRCGAMAECYRECTESEAAEPDLVEDMFDCVDDHLYAVDCHVDDFRDCTPIFHESDRGEREPEVGGCDSDGDCVQGQTCDDQTGRCVASITPEAVCRTMNRVSDAIGCAPWPVDECMGEEDGPQNNPDCLFELSAMISCFERNSDDCYCEDGDNGLNCEPAVKRDETWNPDGPPCENVASAYEVCRSIFDQDFE